MSIRLGTRIGLLVAEERPQDARDVLRFHEPSTGSLARTKGSLFLLAQLSGGGHALARAAREALEALEHDYYYDLSAGPLVVLSKALSTANRRLYHTRGKLGIPRRASVSIIAAAVQGRELHVAKLGPAAAVIVRGGRMYELPPPPAVHEEDPRVRERRVAATLGEALEIEPYAWQGELAAGDRIALVSRNLAQVVGVDELKQALGALRPGAAVEHLQHLFAIRGGRGSDGLLAVEIVQLDATANTRHLEPVRPAEPLAGLPDQSPVPLADALGRFLHRCADAIDLLQAEGIAAHALAPRLLWPLATAQIDPFLEGKRTIFVPEVNYTGQFAQLLKTHYQNVQFTRLNVYGGQPFSVASIVEAVKSAGASSKLTKVTNGALSREEAPVHA
jgi:serine/threonine protein phosphatase PrpC